MYLITNRNFCSRERYLDVLKDASRCGVGNIIIREKDLSDKELENLYSDIKSYLGSVDTNLIINNRIKLFEKLNFDGLHLPFERFLEIFEKGYDFKIFEKEKILGLSLHSLDEVVRLDEIRNQTKLKIGYITLSHIYETDCKKGLKPRGLNLLKACRQITDMKIVALGGILPNNVSDAMIYCDDFAVMSTVMKSKNVSSLIEEYNSEII